MTTTAMRGRARLTCCIYQDHNSPSNPQMEPTRQPVRAIMLSRRAAHLRR
jgi:hypothetical protein